jgi:RNA polymerase sigma-70 factor (ECF subfamily)
VVSSTVDPVVDRPSTHHTLSRDFGALPAGLRLMASKANLRNSTELFQNRCLESPAAVLGEQENNALDETPLIQQYLQFRSEFMGYLYAITRDAELSEEVYQNAAVVVMEQSQKSEAIRNFRAWAKEVIRRQALHAIRARAVSARKARAISPELLEAVSDAFLQDDSGDSVVRNEARALKRCLDDLPEDKRELVAMRYEGSSTFDEISEHVGSTPAAVQRTLSRVRKMLHGCVQRRMRLAEGAS